MDDVKRTEEGETEEARAVQTAVLVDVSTVSTTEEATGGTAWNPMTTVDAEIKQEEGVSELNIKHQVPNLNIDVQCMMGAMLGKFDALCGRFDQWKGEMDESMVEFRQEMIRGNVELKQDLMGKMDKSTLELRQEMIRGKQALMGKMDQNKLELQEALTYSGNKIGQAFQDLSEKMTKMSEDSHSGEIIAVKDSAIEVQRELAVLHKEDREIHAENKGNVEEIMIPGQKLGSVLEGNYPDKLESLLQDLARLIYALSSSKEVAWAVKENKLRNNRLKFKYRGDNLTETRETSVEVFENTDLLVRKHQKWKAIDMRMLGDFFATMFRGGGFIE